MLTRILSALFLISAVPAFAGVVAESETGMVFGDLNCRLLSFDGVKSVKIAPDYFDYLNAEVTLAYTCVTHDGRHWQRTGRDVVEFLTPQFNWETQAWEIGNRWIAQKIDDLHIQLNPDLDMFVWTDPEDEGIAFKVQYKTKPAHQ